VSGLLLGMCLPERCIGRHVNGCRVKGLGMGVGDQGFRDIDGLDLYGAVLTVHAHAPTHARAGPRNRKPGSSRPSSLRTSPRLRSCGVECRWTSRAR
jgi:hypothetical protein